MGLRMIRIYDMNEQFSYRVDSCFQSLFRASSNTRIIYLFCVPVVLILQSNTARSALGQKLHPCPRGSPELPPAHVKVLQIPITSPLVKTPVRAVEVGFKKLVFRLFKT